MPDSENQTSKEAGRARNAGGDIQGKGLQDDTGASGRDQTPPEETRQEEASSRTEEKG